MIVQVFSVFDSKAASFAQPFFSPTIVTAQRAFTGACKETTSMLNQYPEDFCLFHLGEFDDQTGLFAPLVAPVNLGLARIYIAE